MLSARVLMFMSGPGDSTSRSMSFTSSPLPLLAVVPSRSLGGSGQLRAMRNCPFWMNRVVPSLTVLTPSTTNDFVTTAVQTSVLVQSALTLQEVLQSRSVVHASVGSSLQLL